MNKTREDKKKGLEGLGSSYVQMEGTWRPPVVQRPQNEPE